MIYGKKNHLAGNYFRTLTLFNLPLAEARIDSPAVDNGPAVRTAATVRDRAGQAAISAGSGTYDQTHYQRGLERTGPNPDVAARQSIRQSIFSRALISRTCTPFYVAYSMRLDLGKTNPMISLYVDLLAAPAQPGPPQLLNGWSICLFDFGQVLAMGAASEVAMTINALDFCASQKQRYYSALRSSMESSSSIRLSASNEAARQLEEDKRAISLRTIVFVRLASRNWAASVYA